LEDDLAKAERSDGEKPEDHHRTEELPDRAGASALQREDADEYDARQRKDERAKGWLGDFQAFERAQDGDGRRDHPVAEEQRRPGEHEDADDAHRRAVPLLREKREERQDSSLA